MLYWLALERYWKHTTPKHEEKGTNKKGRKKYEGEEKERETHTHTTFMNIYFILPEANCTEAKKENKFSSDVHPK